MHLPAVRMDATNNESLLRIRTHNVNGFDNSKECLFQECDDDAFDILGVQEHWLRPSFKKEKGTNKLRTLHQQFDGFATSGMSTHVGKGLMKGRPFGGTGFLFNKKLSKCLRSRVDVNHERVSVMEMNTKKHQILLINAYMPYFISGNDSQLTEYYHTLAFIQSVMNNHPNHKFIILSDLNCNIFNVTHPYSSLVNGFMNDYDLVSNFSLIDGFDPNLEYTRFDVKRNSFTLIDGILFSRCLSDIVVSSNIIHPHTNISDHLPVELIIKVEIEIFKFTTSPLSFYIPWKTLSESELSHYRETMLSNLRSISIPFYALNHSNNLCSNCDCLIALERFYENIVSAVTAADNTLPRRRHGLAKSYWTPELSELKQKSLDAHRLWQNCNCPRSGPIYLEKVRTNSQYKSNL